MNRNIQDENQSSTQPDKSAQMQQMFEEYQDRRAVEKRWRFVRKIWSCQIGGVPIVAWVLLLAAAAGSLNLSFGRPFF